MGTHSPAWIEEADECGDQWVAPVVAHDGVETKHQIE